MSTPSEPRVFEGRHGDGRSAASRRVAVRLAAGGIEIEREDGSRRLWPWASLAVAVPLGRSTRDVVLTFRPPPERGAAATTTNATNAAGGPAGSGTVATDAAGATLFVAGPDFAAALASRAPHLTAARERWRFARPGIALAMLAALLAGTVYLTDLSPSRFVASLVPRAAWNAIGENVLAGLFQNARICADAGGRRQLDSMVARLTAATGGRETFEVRVIDAPILNAFAVPGRKIVLTRRLVATAGSPEELAGVVAHEMGHGLELHPEASLVRMLGLFTVVKLMLSGGGDALANIGVLLAQLRYTREAEREADAHAVRILREARIPATGLVSFFERLRRDGRGASASLPGGDILSTHPSLDERIASIRPAAYPTEPIMSADDFAQLAAICATRDGARQ